MEEYRAFTSENDILSPPVILHEQTRLIAQEKPYLEAPL